MEDLIFTFFKGILGLMGICGYLFIFNFIHDKITVRKQSDLGYNFKYILIPFLIPIGIFCVILLIYGLGTLLK